MEPFSICTYMTRPIYYYCTDWNIYIRYDYFTVRMFTCTYITTGTTSFENVHNVLNDFFVILGLSYCPYEIINLSLIILVLISLCPEMISFCPSRPSLADQATWRDLYSYVD